MRTVLLVTRDTRYLSRIRRPLSKAGYLTFGSTSVAEAMLLTSVMENVGLVLVDESLGIDAAAAMAHADMPSDPDFRPAVFLVSERYSPGVIAQASASGLAGVISKSESDERMIDLLGAMLEPVGSAEAGYPMPRLSDTTFLGGDSFPQRDREWFESRFISEWGYSRQHETPMTLLMVGLLDHERLAATIGEEGVCGIMDTVELVTQAVISSRDTVGRYDTGIIGIILAETGERLAMETGKRLMSAFRNTEFGNVNRSVRVRFMGGLAIQDARNKRRWKDMKREALAMLENRESRSLDSETAATYAA